MRSDENDEINVSGRKKSLTLGPDESISLHANEDGGVTIIIGDMVSADFLITMAIFLQGDSPQAFNPAKYSPLSSLWGKKHLTKGVQHFAFRDILELLTRDSTTDDGPRSAFVKSLKAELISAGMNDKDIVQLAEAAESFAQVSGGDIFKVPEDNLEAAALARNLAVLLLKARATGVTQLDTVGIESDGNHRPPLPTTPPGGLLYANCGHHDPIRFLEEVYKPWLGAESGRLYRPSLRKLDPQLVTALESRFRGRKAELAKILPRKQEESDERLRAALGEVLDGPQRQSALEGLAKGHVPRSLRKH